MGFWSLSAEEGVELKLEVKSGSGLNFKEETRIEYISKDPDSTMRAIISEYN